MGLLTAGHGKKGDIAASCVATLNTLPSFSKHGGIKVESMLNKLRTLVAEHRAAVKQDPHVSGKRTGASEELHQAMCDITQDLDEAAAAKGEGDAAAVAEEARKNVRAEKVRLVDSCVFDLRLYMLHVCVFSDGSRGVGTLEEYW